MEIIAPYSIGAMLATVVVSGKFSGYLLHKFADFRFVFRIHKQMYVVAGHAIVEQENPALRQCLAHFLSISITVFGELQMVSLVMAPMGQVKYSTLNMEAMGARHIYTILHIFYFSQ
jgi:hypothetical protein